MSQERQHQHPNRKPGSSILEGIVSSLRSGALRCRIPTYPLHRNGILGQPHMGKLRRLAAHKPRDPVERGKQFCTKRQEQHRKSHRLAAQDGISRADVVGDC